MNAEDLQKVIDSLPEKTKGLHEIKIVKAEFATQGTGLLLLHPDDYDEYTKSLEKSFERLTF